MNTNKSSKMDLAEYALLLDELYRTDEVDNQSSVQPIQVEGDSPSESSSDDSNGSLSLLKELCYHQDQHNLVMEKLATIESEQRSQKVKALIVTGSSALSQLQTELAFLNINVAKCSPVKGNTLPVDKSAQRSFLETVDTLRNICTSLDEFTNNKDVDWETVKRTMEEKVANLKTLESNISPLKERTELVATLSENIRSSTD